MKREEFDGTAERAVLIGVATCDRVVARVAPRWEKPGPFAGEHANIIGGWAVEFYNRYGRAPGRALESYYRSWREAQEGTDRADAVRRLLESLSGEYERSEEVNADHLLDVAADLFNTTLLRRRCEAVQADLDRGDVKKALSRWEAVQPMEMGSEGWVDPVNDVPSVEEAFASQGKSIIAYKGGLGEFFGATLERDGFVALMGSAKKGKSFWVQELVWASMRQGLKTAYFEVGDMSRHQVMRRFLRRASLRPFRAETVLWPRSLSVNGAEARVRHERIEHARPMTQAEAKAAMEAVSKKCGEPSPLRLSVHPNKSISVAGVRSIVMRWIRDGWVPDVIAIDYLDIVAPINPKAEDRTQINESWAAARRLSQEFHCLVITATQANAKSYDTDLLKRSNFADDRRKYDHVTYMLGINQTAGEKRDGLYRLNWLVGREEDYSEMEVCHAAGCLAVAAPAVLSHFRGVST